MKMRRSRIPVLKAPEPAPDVGGFIKRQNDFNEALVGAVNGIMEKLHAEPTTEKPAKVPLHWTARIVARDDDGFAKSVEIKAMVEQ
jgi:hypothetical protein